MYVCTKSAACLGPPLELRLFVAGYGGSPGAGQVGGVVSRIVGDVIVT